MAKRNDKEQVPYVILGSAHDQDVKFYERYDANFLYNKVVTLLYIIEHEEEAAKQVEEFVTSMGCAPLSPRYVESLRAEVFFTTLHQCETFFAILLAPFQPLPHWIYLTTYGTAEIKGAIDKIVEGRIVDLTNNHITTVQDLARVAVYSGSMMTDPDLAARWEENIDNVAWLIKRFGRFFQEYDRAYNSYKHGLRVMTGPHRLGIAPQNPDGTVQGPMRIIQSSEDALTYLQQEPVREVDGEKERPISEMTKTFSPSEASFYMFKMQQMLETIRATRLSGLKGEPDGTSLNLFLRIDRNGVLQLAERGDWKVGPARADEARDYDQLVAQMQAEVEKSGGTDEPDVANEESLTGAIEQGNDDT